MKDLPPGVHLVEDPKGSPDRLPTPDLRFVFNTGAQAASCRRVAHWATDLLSAGSRCKGKERALFPIIIVGAGKDKAVLALAEALPRGVEILSYGDRQVFSFSGPTEQAAFYLIAR